VLAANYVAEMNNLFWNLASPELIQAYRLQGYLPAQPEDGERGRAPYRHYEDVCAGDFMGNGGHVITTCSSLHKFAPVYCHIDSYGRSNVRPRYCISRRPPAFVHSSPVWAWPHSSTPDGRIPYVKLTTSGVKLTPVKFTTGFDVVNLTP
jgi:hypothetical protein